MSKKNRLFSVDSAGLHICDLQIYEFSSEQKKKIIQNHVHGRLLPNQSRASRYSQAQASMWTEACAKEPES